MVSMVLVLGVVAFGAGYVPAARASKVDAMVAPREPEVRSIFCDGVAQALVARAALNEAICWQPEPARAPQRTGCSGRYWRKDDDE